METAHKSVLLGETLEYLSPLDCNSQTNPYMIDCNLGEGGHTQAFLQHFPNLFVAGIDADCNIIEVAKQRLFSFKDRVNFVCSWSDEYLLNLAGQKEKQEEKKTPNIILFDLGISNYHYQKSNRGFSFAKDEVLDMRLCKDTKTTASDIVNTYKEEDLANLIYLYSQEKYSRRIAKKIIEYRQTAKITTSKQLSSIICSCVPKVYGQKSIHPATRTFQALRIAVNSELHRLPVALKAAFDVLAIGGKMGVITFHSLEDRITKLFFSSLCSPCICPPNVAVCDCGGSACATMLFKKPIRPCQKEIEGNNASRSAKFRAIRKVANVNEKRKEYMNIAVKGL